jgi:hypothetical protein
MNRSLISWGKGNHTVAENGDLLDTDDCPSNDEGQSILYYVPMQFQWLWAAWLILLRDRYLATRVGDLSM